MKPVFAILVALMISSSMMFSQERMMIKAVKNNNIDSVKILLKKNIALVNVTDDYGRTPLHWAARGVYPDIMKELIHRGADVNARDINEVTPIISVVARNHAEGLQILIENGASTLDKDLEGDYLIHLAASYGYPEMVSILLGKDQVLELRNSRERTPLILACRESGDLETVELLIEKGANVNVIDKYGGSPLSLAAWRGYEPIVNLLLDNGARIEVNGTSGIKLLQYACDKNLPRLYSAISENGGDIISLRHEGQNALHWASMGGSTEIAEDLLKRGIEPDDPDLYGWSPIHYASYFGRKDIVNSLIEIGADLEARTPLNETAFILAASRNNTDVTALLAARGARADASISTDLRGKYFGQTYPDDIPELFAPGIASRLRGGHSNIVFSADADIAFWTEWNLTETGYSDGSKILYSCMQNGEWTYPQVLHPRADCPVFSADGSRMYFLASLPDTDGNEAYGIWFHELNGSSLSDPEYLDFDVQKYGLYWQFSFDNDGNLYFGGSHGLSISRFENGKYQVPQLLSEYMHPQYQGGSPCISPDGDYLVFNSGNLEECFGGSDLYVGFRLNDGNWSAPVNLGPEVNTSQSESQARISPDGDYFFYKTNFGSIKWVDAAVVNRLRPE